MVVDYVVPESAAAAAGLQPSDIIRMVNDQIIVEPDQLGKLIRSFPEGTTVNLTLLRKGKEVKVSAKLQKHEPKSSHGPFGFEKEWNFDDLGRIEKFPHARHDERPRSRRARKKGGVAGRRRSAPGGAESSHRDDG